MRADLVATALRALADALEAQPPDAPAQPASAPTAAPVPRGRGRPPKATEAPAAPAPVEADPFAAPQATVLVPKATPDDVREALTKLAAATTQANAVGVLKAAGGVDNTSALKPDKYDAVVAAAQAALPAAEEVDPFETPTPVVVTELAEAAPSRDDLNKAILAAQKIASVDTVQKIVMKHGGKVATAGGFGVSLNALPVAAYATVIAEFKGLPKTK